MSDVKPVSGFLWGAPIKLRGDDTRRALLDHFFWLVAGGGVEKAVGTEKNAVRWAQVDDYVYALHGRLTDKCAALLQTVAVVAAIETVFIAQDIQANELANLPLGYAAVACFFFCAFLLSFNLFVYWPNHTIASEADAEVGRKIWRVSLLKMVQARTWKHTLAVCLLLLGLVFSGADRALDISGVSLFAAPAPPISAKEENGAADPVATPEPLPDRGGTAALSASTPTPTQARPDLSAPPEAPTTISNSPVSRDPEASAEPSTEAQPGEARR